MANSSTQVRLAPDGKVFVGPPGTTLPTNATMSLDAALKEVGYIDEQGVSMTPDVGLKDIMMWQSATAVKTTLDTVKFSIKFNMGQVNFTTWGLYFFNTTPVNVFGGSSLTIPSNPPSQERTAVIEWTDDEGDVSRLVLPACVLDKRDALKLVRKDAQILGVELRALDYNGVLAYVYSENPDLIPAS